ncbi:MAG: ABC transporter ATP-binding protein [Ilumatobacteraceae bacterium]
MTGVTITGLVKRFGSDVYAINNIDIEIAEHELLVLLGPSGCGKSTILRSIAGLEQPTKGRIAFGDTVVFDDAARIDIEPMNRGLGMVFQNYALWPHMTVADNIGFPLAAMHVRRAERSERIAEMARLVECEQLLHRYPGELSGGQQQRIALARSLVARPAVLLFDEPLSNLDARLRADMRSMIRELHRTLGFTGVYVTHDQEEGLTIGDRVAIMHSGQVVQLGPPREVFAHPATEWAADFMGMTNRVHVNKAQDANPTPWRRQADTTATAPDSVVRVRPDDVTIADFVAPDDDWGLIIEQAEIKDRTFGGNATDFVFDLDGRRFLVRLASDTISPRAAEPGDRVTLVARHDKIRSFALSE